MAKKMTPPKTVYIVVRRDADCTYFLADETTDDFLDGEAVGVYTRTKIVTKRVRHTVE